MSTYAVVNRAWQLTFDTVVNLDQFQLVVFNFEQFLRCINEKEILYIHIHTHLSNLTLNMFASTPQYISKSSSIVDVIGHIRPTQRSYEKFLSKPRSKNYVLHHYPQFSLLEDQRFCEKLKAHLFSANLSGHYLVAYCLYLVAP